MPSICNCHLDQEASWKQTLVAPAKEAVRDK